MEAQTQGKPRRWGRIIAFGCLGVMVLGIAAAATLFVTVMGSIKRSEVYRGAIARAHSSPAATAALGEPFAEGWLVSGSVNLNGPSGTASLSIPLSGPRGEGTLYAEATREAGEWSYSLLQLEAEATGERFDLLAEAELSTAEAGAPPAEAAAGSAAAVPGAPGAPIDVGAIEIPSDLPMMVWARRNYGSWENPLHTELAINGRTVNIFTSDTYEPIGEYLEAGWNTVTMTTTPHYPAAKENDLIFHIGPMYKDEQADRMVMSPVLWTFRNGTDWKLADGRYSHPLGPAVQEVTVSYRLMYTGMQHEQAPVQAGDYVLDARPNYSSWNSPVVAAVLINGTPLNSFLLERRQLVVTPLLRPGKNELRLVSTRVKGSVADNDILISLGGPAEWSVAQEGFLTRPIVEIEAMTGWSKDPKTGMLLQEASPEADTIDRTVSFFVKEVPAAGG